jgi:hypothetical protein
LAACGELVVDVGRDAAVAGGDGGLDSGTEAGGIDAGSLDGGVDAGDFDGGPDAGADAGGSDAGLDAGLAVYGCISNGAAMCQPTDVLDVGSRPLGAGLFGHLDLAGSMNEWTVDACGPYPNPCVDCANIGNNPDAGRVLRGGGYATVDFTRMRSSRRFSWAPANNDEDIGIRCAR